MGLVFAIEEFSAFDGPGIRTTVFLKGCKLNCSWCHNPEGKSLKNEIIKNNNGCLGCKKCIEDTGFLTEKSILKCPKNLIRFAAKEYTPEQLAEKVLKNKDFFDFSNGGVTFSGGEPTVQYEFLVKCLKLLKNKVNRALQTCGYLEEDKFKVLLKNTDCFLYDLKIIDNEKHIKYTGVSNKLILNNYKALVKENVKHYARTPLIPTVTDTEENITDICEFLTDLGENKIQLLPYNSAAGAKYHLINKKYSPCFNDKIQCNPHLEIFKRFGIKAEIL